MTQPHSLVPTIDVSGWGQDPAAEAAIVAAVDAACASIGFLSITGHCIDPGLIEAMLAEADAFFELDENEKNSYRSPSPEINRGFTARETEALALSLGVQTPPDLFEAFNIGTEEGPSQTPNGDPVPQEMFAANIWPARPAGFRAAVSDYFAAAGVQAAQLLEIFAVALGEERNFFTGYTSHSTDTMRINHYLRAPGQSEPVDGQQRMGAHTDYGMVTVLYADSVPGLEIVGPDGLWHGFTPPPGSLLVNLGDLMATWTNDRWKSSLHRVVPPPRAADGPAHRRSVAFFRDGNYDALVECLPSCVDDEHPARYAPVLAGEHLMAKLLGPRTLMPSTAASTAGDRIDAVTSTAPDPQ
ncbi:2-oxoglutarate and iron-dependent oxygenase domain-containing protein [Jatrophihabitans sp.]|uniref:isopenicillin N synthase family dioxygenase n=1 Tax=Jatrophihabitans sp. TaxID=1932789 RepID=UPI0030C73DAD|nr:putative Oxidoreductase, 2OG-Fe(II) oxygenase family [Jatrophihabitans sp.]